MKPAVAPRITTRAVLMRASRRSSRSPGPPDGAPLESKSYPGGPASSQQPLDRKQRENRQRTTSQCSFCLIIPSLYADSAVRERQVEATSSTIL